MPKRTKKDKRPVAKIDFKPYGAAIKAGRTKQKESRNKAADALFISPRYLANIENKGQHPSVQVFLELMSRYHISVDQILHGEAMEGKSTERMQFETLLDELTDAEIKILTATAQSRDGGPACGNQPFHTPDGRSAPLHARRHRH